MLQLHDIRESRAYQEAMEEGRKEALARAIPKMAVENIPAEKIAAILEVDLEMVRNVLAGQNGNQE